MSIKEIKQKLSILTVLSHYNLEANRNNMLRCPFHEDKEASMRVYPETNTVYCFAGSCKMSNLDVIDFVMEMDNGTKHEAIKKAEQLLGEQGEIKPIIQTPKAAYAPLAVEQQFKHYLKSFSMHEKSHEYCEGRALEWQALEIGYLPAQSIGKSQKTKDASTEKADRSTDKQVDKWARACIIFPLKNEFDEIVSLYGRSIYAQGHYYQTGRNGLYPVYPKQETKTLLLTESIIDAATILPFYLGCAPDSHQEFTVLALYGTNGLTAEHKKAIKKLNNLKEIILALDADEAGRMATVEIAKTLAAFLPGITISSLVLPEGEDINSLAVNHENLANSDGRAGREKLFKELLVNRKVINIKKAIPKVVPVKRQDSTEADKSTSLAGRLDTKNPHNIIFITGLATYYIKGGIRTSAKDLDSLKVTLVVEFEGRKSRQKLDLYEDKQVVRTAHAVGERLGLRPDLLEIDLSTLTDLLETYREKLRDQEPGNTSQKVEVSSALKSECMQFWKSDDLLKRLNELIGKAGIVGEQNNRLLLFVIASSYKMSTTLHALVQGSSGSGKTKLLDIISKLMPEESVKRYTRVTDGSFYNQGEYFFVNKLVCFEDLDGLKEDAQLAVRELQSNEILITSTSIKDANGSIYGGERIVRGPIASISCTTNGEIYEDNISRCFVLAVDESKEQSMRVIQYQNDKSAGVLDGKKEKERQLFMQNCMRLLQPLEVVNPYANKIQLPKDAHKIRRLNELYQSFVRQITLLHQYQRQRDGRGRVVSTVADLQAACDILFESIILKVDELDGSLRQFFEQLKSYVESKGKEYEFNRFEVRQATGVSKTQQHRYMSQLIYLEYLRQQGYANRGYRYKIAHWDDIAALRSQVKNHLNQQLNALT